MRALCTVPMTIQSPPRRCPGRSPCERICSELADWHPPVSTLVDPPEEPTPGHASPGQRLITIKSFCPIQDSSNGKLVLGHFRLAWQAFGILAKCTEWGFSARSFLPFPLSHQSGLHYGRRLPVYYALFSFNFHRHFPQSISSYLLLGGSRLLDTLWSGSSDRWRRYITERLKELS